MVGRCVIRVAFGVGEYVMMRGWINLGFQDCAGQWILQTRIVDSYLSVPVVEILCFRHGMCAAERRIYHQQLVFPVVVARNPAKTRNRPAISGAAWRGRPLGVSPHHSVL